MAKEVKKQAVKELTQRYQNLKNCVFVNFTRFKALHAGELRDYLGREEIKMNILSNPVARYVFDQLNMPEAKNFLNGPTALVFSLPGDKGDDPITLSKTFLTWRNKNPDMKSALQIQGGYAEGKAISAQEVTGISRMLPPEAILSQLAGAFNSPLSSLARGLKGIPQKCALLLKAYSEKKG